MLDEKVASMLARIALPDDQIAECRAEIERAQKSAADTLAASRAELTALLGTITSRLTRLTDVFIEGGIDKAVHDERRGALLTERQKAIDALANVETDQGRATEVVLRCLELARSPENLYRAAPSAEKRRLLQIMTSNRTVSGKNVEISVAEPFLFLARVRETSSCALQRGKPRTLGKTRTALCATLLDWAKANEHEVERIGNALVQEQVTARFAA
jgi:hypothetical protein